MIGNRRWPRRTLVAVNILVAACLIGVISGYAYTRWRLDQIHKENLPSLTADEGKAFTLLIVGSDTRAALQANDPQNDQFGNASETPGQRSDTIILARVVPSTHQIMMLSIPRDLWVNIPGQGMNRINSAFDTSANLLIQTIQTDLGIPVNHYVEVNFDTFQAITDAVGGVNFYFPTPAKDAYSLLNVPKAGCVLLTGTQALAFVRSRHYEYYEDGYWHDEAESDLARIQRQQTFIKKMIKKAESEFTNPIKLNDVIGAVTKNLTVDSNFSTNLMLGLATTFKAIDASGIPSLTLPNYGFTTAGGAEVLGLQQPQASQTIAAFKAFGTSSPSSTSQTSTHSKSPAVTVAPSSVSVEVANGTGVSGQAGQVAQVLSGDGYAAKTTQSTPGYGNVTTEVLYAPDSATAAQQIAAAIPGGATTKEDSALKPTAYNVEVVTGSSFTISQTAGGSSSGSSASSGSSGSSASSGSSTSVAATTTTIPGTNTSNYVLPGMPAGETPPSC